MIDYIMAKKCPEARSVANRPNKSLEELDQSIFGKENGK
jgi:hypothetical protein